MILQLDHQSYSNTEFVHEALYFGKIPVAEKIREPIKLFGKE
jgi:hypothetical protein